MNLRTVHEVSQITGISVRTLHHYDAIGLLKPAKVTPAGYRLYGDTSLGRLQSILFFRELQFPLKEIKAILDSPGYDSAKALSQQIHLLELQYKHIGELIAFAREIQKKGVDQMNFKAFDKSEIEQYKEEARARWGGTTAWQEYEQRAKNGQNFAESAGRLMDIFTELGKLRAMSPADQAVQDKIIELQNFITANYYTCTKEILSGLGQMYVADERMRHNIDQAGGPGTAAFASQAIAVYCKE